MSVAEPELCETTTLLCVEAPTGSCTCWWVWFDFTIYFTNTHKRFLHVNIHKVQISGFTVIFPLFSSHSLLQ